jgi:hypothetical protein
MTVVTTTATNDNELEEDGRMRLPEIIGGSAVASLSHRRLGRTVAGDGVNIHPIGPTVSPITDSRSVFRRRPQNVPSVARVAAGAFGFLIFSHAFDGPDLYGALSFFETMPSKPSLQMALNIPTPSPSVCSTY